MPVPADIMYRKQTKYQIAFLKRVTFSYGHFIIRKADTPMAVTKEILALAVEIGDALLRNGAEVYRVEDTVMHILKAYEIENYDVYVLSNGIFARRKRGSRMPAA